VNKIIDGEINIEYNVEIQKSKRNKERKEDSEKIIE
jgi:hypothetical protein